VNAEPRTSSPATSRRMSAAAIASDDEELRADLQQRLALLFMIMFWSLALLVLFVAWYYEAYDGPDFRAPARRVYVYLVAGAGLPAMGFFWRVLLLRRRLVMRSLYRIDYVYAAAIGGCFGATTFLQKDVHPSSYLALVYITFTVFARSLIVPSTARRTAIASALAYVPMTASAIAVTATEQQDFHWAEYFLGCVLLAGCSIALATFGSDIIYGLRRTVRAAKAKQLGQYTLVREIGSGGMGRVYLAHHFLMRRPTAVKILRGAELADDDLARFEREVQAMSRLTHPNTVAVYDYGRSLGGELYYAMEYLDGVDLEKLVRATGPQPSGRVIAILAQVCGALQEAHDRGIVHRDIKPGNIIVCERGGVPDVAKVVDFGLAKDLADDAAASTRFILGTAAYLAPERVTGAVGVAADLYALGAVAYFLLVGRPPFSGKNHLEVVRKHVTEAPVPPSRAGAAHVPPALDAIVMRCLAKAADARYASARALADALLAVPPASDWDDAAAALWWRDWRARERDTAAAAHVPTQTITVDLGQRARG
jgi:hypothetical protein